MKKLYLLMMAMFVILLSSCYRSQFSTTTRDYKNGKVKYTNHYHTEKSKLSKGNFHKHQLKDTGSPISTFSSSGEDVRSSPEPEITKINPAPLSDNKCLIASTSNEPTLIAVRKNQMVSVNDLILSLKKHYGFNISNSFPDTIKSKVPKKESINNDTDFQVIKFKNGHEQAVKIIQQSHDTLKYRLIYDPEVLCTAMMEQVDTIFQVESYSRMEKVVDTRKSEPFGIVGFICSLLGFVPVYGIPFALLAIIFGLVSAYRIYRNPERFKGGLLAYYSLIIGIAIIEWTIVHYLSF
jgi:hypothetical protein